MQEPCRIELLTCAEVEKTLKVSRATVIRMIRQGKFKGRKVGSALRSSPWRIYKDSFDAYLAQVDNPTT